MWLHLIDETRDINLNWTLLSPVLLKWTLSMSQLITSMNDICTTNEGVMKSLEKNGTGEGGAVLSVNSLFRILSIFVRVPNPSPVHDYVRKITGIVFSGSQQYLVYVSVYIFIHICIWWVSDRAENYISVPYQFLYGHHIWSCQPIFACEPSYLAPMKTKSYNIPVFIPVYHFPFLIAHLNLC